MTTCIAQRLWSKVDPDPLGCWTWTGATNPNGYGYISNSGRMAYTHRVAAELFYGPIPDGLVVDHLCRNRACCNPAHLDLVTQRENLMRGDTLTAAHAAGTDCGFAKCTACQRHRVPAEAASGVTS